MCFRRVANCLVVAALKTKSPHESAHPRIWRRIRLRKRKKGGEGRSKLNQAWFYSIYVGRKQDKLYARTPLKKYKADVCIFPTAVKNIIVKMFNINREWEKTNTASELLHFLCLKYIYMWHAQWLEFAQYLFYIKVLKVISTKII